MFNRLTTCVIATTVGVLIGGVCWLVIFITNFEPEIGYDGPAGLLLVVSMLLGGASLGIPSIALYARKKSFKSFLKALAICLISGVAALFIFGHTISDYATSHYGYCQQYGRDSAVCDDVKQQFVLFYF